MMQMTWYVWYTYTWYTLLIVCFNIKGEKIAGELWRKNQDLNQNYWSSVVFCPVHFLFQVQKIQLLRWPFKKSFEVGWINSYQICRQVTYKCPTSRLFFFFFNMKESSVHIEQYICFAVCSSQCSATSVYHLKCWKTDTEIRHCPLVLINVKCGNVLFKEGFIQGLEFGPYEFTES